MSDAAQSSNSSPDSRYTMDIETTIVDKLGVKLYDRVSAVVAELIANSYDADAENVEVKLPINKYLATHTSDGVDQKGYDVVVRDDGHGMTPQEADEMFLRVGRDRREDEGSDTSREKGRPVMGRKGIGKLAPFGICKKIEVMSAGGEPDQDEYEISHFEMDYNEITNRDGEETADYKPEPLSRDGEMNNKRGTIIKLKEFNVKKVPTKEVFKRKLGERFATGVKDFSVEIIDTKEESSVENFYLSDSKPPLQEGTKISVDGQPVQHGDKAYSVSGWMALSENSYEDEFGGVKVYARGKLASITRDFGLAPGFTGEFVARSYLIGEIHADWLDQEDRDLIRTHRQDILWDTDLGESFSEWGKQRVREVAKSGEEPRRERTSSKFLEKSNIESRAADRYEKEGIQDAAVELGESLGQYAHEDELKMDEYVDSLTNFILQIAPHKYLVDVLQQIRDKAEEGQIEVEELLELFESTHIAEITSYGQVARNKLNTIDVLDEKIHDFEAEEKELHEILENSPWLIDPSWQPITSETSIKKVREEFEQWYNKNKVSDDEKPISVSTDGEYNKKRPDLVLLEMRNSIRVVELKRPETTVKDEGIERFFNYIQAFQEFFDAKDKFTEDFNKGLKMTLVAEDIDVEFPNEETWKRQMEEGNIDERISWTELLNRARKYHSDFIDAREQVPDVDEDAFAGLESSISTQPEDNNGT